MKIKQNKKNAFHSTEMFRQNETKGIGDIYFFEVTTKYISSNVVKISVNSRVPSIDLWFLPKKRVNFLFIFFSLLEN